MAAVIGVTELNGLTAPSGGFVHESSKETTRETATIRNASGVTVVAVPKPLITTDVMIKGVGDPELAGVTAGSFTAGTVKIISAKGEESNSDFPTFEIKAQSFETAA
jgi:hypothetical protein